MPRDMSSKMTSSKADRELPAPLRIRAYETALWLLAVVGGVAHCLVLLLIEPMAPDGFVVR